MKYIKYLLILIILMPVLGSCHSAEEAAKQRRNLMMPKTGELTKNKKYKAPKKKKTYGNTKSSNYYR